MPDPTVERVLDACVATIRAHEPALTALDAAIGDGDHGLNLLRGAGALDGARGELVGLPLADALRRAGEIVGCEVGGNGGTVYAALLRTMAQMAPAGRPDLAALASMLEAGVAAAQEASGARRGDKTMLDVLIPVVEALKEVARERRPETAGGRAVAAAAYGLHATTRLEARRGLAADLGAASTNHMDPGALSAALLVGAVVGALESSAA